MFGYVKPDVGELLVREHEFYRAAYCGVCRSMKALTGLLSTAALTYDSVFLSLVRMLWVPDEGIAVRRARCLAHPMKRRAMLVRNEASDYTARVFAVLSYYKMRDDIADERGARRAAARASLPALSAARRRADLPELDKLVSDKLAAIREEENPQGDPEHAADLFGDVMSALFSEGLSGEAKTVTSALGHYLGRFIWFADAAEDFDSDRAAKKYNPYVTLYGDRKLTDGEQEAIYNALMLECRGIESAVNLLPFGNRRTIEEIVRNIIYLGLKKRVAFLLPGGTKENGEDNHPERSNEI